MGGGGHDYLGMTTKYSDSIKVRTTMPDYIEVLLEETPASLIGESAIHVAKHIFEVDANDKPYIKWRLGCITILT